MTEWTKVNLPTSETSSPPQGSSSDSPSDKSDDRERPNAVMAMAAYQWLKAALFVQMFWNSWSALSHSSAAITANLSADHGQNHAVFLLLAVALYLIVLGWGLFRLQKWALLLILLSWLLDLVYDFNPELFGLEHTPSSWPIDHAALFLGITLADAVAYLFFANRETFRAFDAEDEGKLYFWLTRMYWWIR